MFKGGDIITHISTSGKLYRVRQVFNNRIDVESLTTGNKYSTHIDNIQLVESYQNPVGDELTKSVVL